MQKRGIVGLAALGAAAGLFTGLGAVGAESRPDFRPEQVVPVLEEAETSEDRSALADLHAETAAMLDSGSLRALHRDQAQTWAVGTRLGQQVCLVAVVGPAADRVTSYSCASPDDVAEHGLALGVRRRADPRDPLEGYGGVLGSAGWIPEQPTSSPRAPLVLFEDVDRPGDIRAAFGTPDGRRVEGGFSA